MMMCLRGLKDDGQRPCRDPWNSRRTRITGNTWCVLFPREDQRAAVFC